MPSSKRKSTRRKAAEMTMQNTSDIDMPDSSPTRPSAKKRKINGTRSSRRGKSITPDPIIEDQPEDASADESENVSQTDFVESIIAYLTVSKEPVSVAREHANEGATEKVEAYAKIAGKDWTYYVHDQTVNIGRPPDERQPSASVAGASSPVQDLKDQFPVHIDLGPSKIVSRHHASIFYDADWPEGGGWHVRVNGRNGVRVNNQLLRRSARQQIHSGAILEIAGTQMMFVLPNDKVQIDQSFLDRIKALATGEDVTALSDAHTEPDGSSKVEPALTNVPGYQSLAPAPPNFKRASTPPQQIDGKNQRTVFDSKSVMSPMYGRGLMLESTHEIDYSRDAARDLKPPYSYAHMIAQAIFSSEEEKLTLSNIYSFIADKYAFYRHSNSGWQNSIRHNLSLNKAFQKVPRRTDEPGKGMKWQIAPEYRQEYMKKMHRRSGGSSNPSSPASSKDVNPNFRGPNGQNLGYDTSMVTQFSAKDASDGPQSARLNMSFPPYPGPPQYIHGPPRLSSQSGPNVASTPQRSRTNTTNTLPDNSLDDSPLPTQYPGHGRPGHNLPFYALPNSGAPHHSPTNPTLSSSYLDTPFHPSQHSSIITPAPLRQNPRLAPPSTLVAPSKFMPESSPAGPGLFWKGFLGGMTPGPPGSALPPDLSPVKIDASSRSRRVNGLDDRDIMSSSPPPMDGPLGGSPSKPARGRAGTITTLPSKSEYEENVPIHSTLGEAEKGAKVLGPSNSLTEANGNARLGLGPGPGLNMSRNNASSKTEHKAEDDEEGDGGFDLARGFAPIGSFSSQRSGGVRS